MIPIRLSIQGMYSYQDRMQTIEFEPLLEAGLFGIFGAVGSGKSSILEAITMALYGESERLNKSGDDRNYNMMNLRSDQMLVDFEFLNFEDKRYRFAYKARRNSKNYAEVRSPVRLAYVWKEDGWESLDHTDGELVTGLSYDNFKRTVIIPQGRFQEFLNLTPSHRSEMLKDLFYLDKYDLSSSTNQLKKENEEAIHRIEGRLTGYESVVPEALTDSENKISQLRKELIKSTEEFQGIKTDLESLQRLQQLHSERELKQKEFILLEEQEPAIRIAEKTLNQYIEAERRFLHLMDRQREQEESLKKLQTTVGELTEEKQVLEKQKSSLEEEYQLLQEQIAIQEERRRRAVQAQIAARLLIARVEFGKISERITNGNAAIQDNQVKIEKQKKALEALESNIEETRKTSINRELLIELRNRFGQKEELQTRLKSLMDQQKNAQESFERYALDFLVKVGIEDGLLEPVRVGEILDERRIKIESAINEQKKDLNHHQVYERLAEFVDELESGEPCPLCGSVEHPAPANFNANSALRKQIESEIVRLEEERQTSERNGIEWNQILKDQRKLAADEEKNRQEQSILKEKIQVVVAYLEVHKENYHSIVQVEEALKTSAQIISDLKLKEDELKAERKQTDKLQSDLERYREKVGQIKSERDQLQGEISAQTSLLSPEELDQVNDFTVEEWHALSDKILMEIKLEQEKQLELSKLRDSMVIKYSQLESTLQTTAEYLEKENNNLKLTADRLNQSLAASSFESLDEVRTVLARDLDIAHEELRIREHDRQVHVLKEVLEDLKQKMNGRSFDAATYKSLSDSFRVKEKKLAELSEETNFEIKRLEELRKMWLEKEALQKERSALIMRSENLDTLVFLFRGKGFVNYVSTVYMREITEIANRRFRLLTHNHFALVLAEDNQFLVRDYLNDGQLRSVKTLSGGQTFQVSLCLALALAESLQNQNKSNQNFFFLDEGFGTLDKDAMELVFESLKSLQKEGRTVGVISHVEALQEEIERHLMIVNDVERGSQISEKWKG